MLRYALRRILWAIPTLFGISLVVFFLTTLIPDPAARTETGSSVLGGELSADVALEEQRRSRFLDLPRFFNGTPVDSRARAEAAAALIAKDDPSARLAASRLVRLGGAALPHVLPKLEELAPEERKRLAVALMPIATRMGLATREALEDADQAVLFWTHFWEDRALEFTAPAVHRAVVRLVEHASDPRTDMRERDLLQVDTFALREVLETLKTANDAGAMTRLTRMALHVTGRGMLVPEGAGGVLVRRVRADWAEWWYVHESDYIVFGGAERIAAALGQTRYGKWLMRTVTGHLGVSVTDGEPIASKLMDRAPITLLITLVAMFASYALAIPIGVIAAWRRGRVVDTLSAGGLFALYSLPTFWTAELLRRAFVSSIASDSTIGVERLILPVATLTLASLATLSRYQRTAMLDVLGQDYIRTARAKGVSTMRVLIVHALRNALLPTVTLAGLQLPALLGGAFIVEEAFRIPGLGFETLRAVESHDAFWLMATVVLAAVVTTAGLIASDVAYGVLDPRVRERMGARS